MRIYVRGPHVGPVRTTLWSSSSRTSGKGCAVVMLLLVLVVTVSLLLHSVVAVVLFGFVAVAVIGGFWQEHQRKTPARPRGPYYGAASPQDAAIVADLNTRPADVRSRLRQMCATGELAMIPGYHWTDGDVQVRDTPKSPAEYSDRR